MNPEVVLSCAVTGSGNTADKSPHVPVTPEQIATAAIEAAKAGATVAHCHVRDPETGKGSRDPALYREVVDRIRSSDTDVVINLTSGMGGDIVLGNLDAGEILSADGTDMVGADERLIHVKELLPEICTLDCGTMNFAEADYVMTNTPGMLEKMAKIVQKTGVKPELEVFDTGHLWLAKHMLQQGWLDQPPLFQICLGIPWGAPADTAHMKTMVDAMPEGANWAAFGISRMQMPMVAQAVILGGHVRVGLEDNLYLEKGVLATNAQLVEKARKIIELLGARVVSPEEGRQKLGLNKQV